MLSRPVRSPFGFPSSTSFPCILAASTALWLPALAVAGPVTVSNSTSQALRTSTGDGAGSGNITVEANGSITVSSGVPITVDSNNDVTVNGSLRNDLLTGATGLLVDTNSPSGGSQTLVSTITLGGLINIPGPSDPNTSPANNFGLRFAGSGILQGSFISASGSQISVGGRESIGIVVDSAITGSFTMVSAISLNGSGSQGVRTSGTIGGDFTISGTIQAPGQDTIGVLTGGAIAGTVQFTSSISTGQQSYFDSNAKRVEATIGGPAMWIGGSVGQGILLEGNQVPTALESSTTVAADAPVDSILAVEGTNFGALRIGPGSATGSNSINIGLRNDGSGDSITMRGRVQSSTSKTGAAVTGVVITGGTSGGAIIQTALQGGITNRQGNIDAVSVDASATGIQIGDYASVPFFYNTGYVSVTSTDSGLTSSGLPGNGGGTVVGLSVASTSVFHSLINTGNFAVQAGGKNFDATAFIDNSGTLTYFENVGTFSAAVANGGTGRTIAADMSRSTSSIDFRNSGTLTGDVTFGSGNDTFLSTAGTIQGAYSFGAGNDNVTIRNTTFTGPIDLGSGNHNVIIEGGSKYTGGIARGAGTTQLTIADSEFVLTGGLHIETSSANITGASKLDLRIDGQDVSRPLLNASGLVVIDPSVSLTTRLAGLVTQSETITLIRAGQLQFGIPLAQLGTNSSSYIYNFQYRISPSDSNSLLLDVARRTASQLGLAANIGTVYENSLSAMASDNELFSAIAAAPDKSSFESVMSQLMPDSSDASLYAALRSQNLAYGVIRSRLQGIPRTTGPSAGVDYSSFWVQQLGSYGKRDGSGEQPGYKIYSVGIATGFDSQFTPDLKAGMSLAQIWNLPDELITRDRPMRIASTQLDFYGRHQNGSNFTQAIFGGSYNAYRSERRVITGSIKREPLGRWKGFNLGGAIDTGTTMRLSDFRLTTYLRGSYIRTHENSYEESGGGAGVDLAYDSRSQDSMRAGAGFIAERRFTVFQDVGIEATFRGDIARELSADPANITARFAAGGVKFTQIGLTPDKNVLGAGISLGVRDIFTAFSVDYDAEKSGDFLGHTVSATFRFRF